MANVRIMTDSIACIPSDLAETHHIRVIPAANIIASGKNYVEGVDLNAAEAYELINKDPDNFVTSAITPGAIAEIFREVSSQSQSILFITISSALSAVSQSAHLAADIIRDESPQTEIRIIDSKACAGVEGLVVLATAKAAEKGSNLDELTEFTGYARSKTGGIMILDTLRYIYRTGRMSKTASRIVSIFNIRPINRVTEEGTVVFVDRVRKRSDGYKRMIDLIKKEAGTNALHFMISHADALDMAQDFSAQLRQEFDCLSMIISDFSPVMGYGTGPGALVIGFQHELDM